VVDVRDIADLHLRAMTHPAANGQRFLATAGDCMSLLEIAAVLRRRLGTAANKAPVVQLPDWLVRLVAKVYPLARQAIPELGKVKNATNEKARHLLGWTPAPREECIVATAESLMRYDLLKDRHDSLSRPAPPSGSATH
jgi:dihydroflavonol-4-reductase